MLSIEFLKDEFGVCLSNDKPIFRHITLNDRRRRKRLEEKGFKTDKEFVYLDVDKNAEFDQRQL